MTIGLVMLGIVVGGGLVTWSLIAPLKRLLARGERKAPSTPVERVQRGTYIDAYARPDRHLKPGHVLPCELDNRHLGKHMRPPYTWCPEECSHEA